MQNYVKHVCKCYDNALYIISWQEVLVVVKKDTVYCTNC